MAQTDLSIRIHADSLSGRVERVRRALLSIAERLPEFRKGLVDLAERRAAFDLDSSTAPGTCDLRVTLKPSYALCELLAASGASDAERRAVEDAFFGHVESSVGLSQPDGGRSLGRCATGAGRGGGLA
jgi:hypothetical protein